MKAMLKPVILDVFQMTPEAHNDRSTWPDWVKEVYITGHSCYLNAWLIRGSEGVARNCSPQIFAEVYQIIPEWMAPD